MNYLINIFLGFAVAQLIDIFTRNSESEHSPVKFNIIFFLKDNMLKIIISLLLSISIGTIINFNNIDPTNFLKELLGINITIEVFYLLLGYSPEVVLQIFKKTYGFLQPKNIKIVDKNTCNKEVYKRK